MLYLPGISDQVVCTRYAITCRTTTARVLSGFRGQVVYPSQTARTMLLSAYASRFRINRYDTVISHDIVPVYMYVYTVPCHVHYTP